MSRLIAALTDHEQKLRKELNAAAKKRDDAEKELYAAITTMAELRADLTEVRAELDARGVRDPDTPPPPDDYNIAEE